MEAVIFFVVAALALVGALGVVLGRNPVHCALFLVGTMMAMAVFFVMQDADLLAGVQVIVYASAIVVLFLFVIMLLGVDRAEALEEPLKGQRIVAGVLGLILLAQILFLAGADWVTGARSTRGVLSDSGGENIERVARVLFTDFFWPFQLTAVMLVIAVVGGVVLARRSRGTAAGTSERFAGDDETVGRR